MKRIAVVAFLIAFCGGCTTTNITTDRWSMKRKSFLQRLEIPEVRVETNGTVTLKGYRNDGGNEALAGAISAAVSAAMKAAK